VRGDDDQIVPYKDASLLQAKLLKHGTLEIYPGYPHGMLTTNAEVINADLLAFIKLSFAHWPGRVISWATRASGRRSRHWA
jgi:pimeloyl-ACP methyl ester carboxylesterase